MTTQPYSLISPSQSSLIDAAPVSREKLQIQRVFQGTGARVIRLTLAAGQIMREHSTNAPLLVHVLDGHVLFRVAGDELDMPTGAIVHVDPSVMHEVEAVSDSHLLLTMTLG